MTDWIVAHEGDIRLGAFVGVLTLMLALEALAPRRATPMRRALRWPSNLGVVVLDTVVVRLLLPLGAVGAALWARGMDTGLFQALAWPGWLEGTLSFLALDCLIYWQHRIFHTVPFFWRLHRMHHSDVEFDATTALRFHPVEIVLSMLIKIAAVAALGAPAIAVIAFEIALNAGAMFNHANLRLPLALDRMLRAAIVTPDMHRVHHSIFRREHDSNYGFSLSWWDRLFGSYTGQPEGGHQAMQIGLTEFRADAEQKLWPLLAQPARPVVRH